MEEYRIKELAVMHGKIKTKYLPPQTQINKAKERTHPCALISTIVYYLLLNQVTCRSTKLACNYKEQFHPFRLPTPPEKLHVFPFL